MTFHRLSDDETGNRFGMLTVISRAESKWGGATRWKCICDCGEEKIVDAHSLLRGRTKSCGSHPATKHGKSATRVYWAWIHMIHRCTDPKYSSYEHYGARGIKVCDRWLNSLENFHADMGDAPDGMELDRYPNNDGNYEPSNCRWATRVEQMNNTRRNRLISFQGRTQTVSQWAREFGLDGHTISKRLKRGWSEEKSVSTPTQVKP